MNTPTERIKLLPCAYCGDGRKCCGNFDTLVDPPECRECPERKHYMNKQAADALAADLIYTTVMLARLRNTAIADALDAAKELMDCKGYDLYPDGTMRPAHGLGEWVKAEDYDKLHAAAISQRDTARDDALEEAAKVCDEYAKSGVTGAMVCAAAIRAIKISETPK